MFNRIFLANLRQNILTLICLTIFAALSAKAVLAQEIPVTTDSRIKTLIFNPNEVYQLKFHYGYQSFIEFSDDESIEMISIGESFAWRLTPAGKRLFVRPLEIAAHTNMTIITNKRTYQFDIRSGEYDGKADEELVYVVRFFYPSTRPLKPVPPQLTKPNPGAVINSNQPSGFADREAKIVRSPVPDFKVNEEFPGMLKLNSDKNILNLDYQFAGKASDITPLKVFDNGQETSFQFKNNNLVIPSINMVDIFGNEIPVNYVIKDNYVVTPTISSQFTLRLADSLICVFNNKILSGR